MTSTLICWANSVPSLFPCKRKKSESSIDTIALVDTLSIVKQMIVTQTRHICMNNRAMPDNEKRQEYEAYNYMLHSYLMGTVFMGWLC